MRTTHESRIEAEQRSWLYRFLRETDSGEITKLDGRSISPGVWEWDVYVGGRFSETWRLTSPGTTADGKPVH